MLIAFLYDQAFLNNQADARQIRHATLSANRGSITDRNGEPLAVSTPVDSVWVEPRALVQAPEYIPTLAEMLGLREKDLTERLSRNSGKEFLYLKRHMNPTDAAEIDASRIPGVHLLREYRRYYPAAEVTGHLVGFANVDDVGQEGLGTERAQSERLRAEQRRRRIAACRVDRESGRTTRS